MPDTDGTVECVDKLNFRTDLDRGARAVVRDPGYRSEIGRVALRWAADKGGAVDTAIVLEDLDCLAKQDQKTPQSSTKGGSR